MFTVFPVCLILLASAFYFSTSAAAVTVSHNRRTLHQPFFPLDSLPPSQPPSPLPPAPKVPLSTSTPNQQPFFPSYPSPPPPPSPPSPASFASFPANISSLNLPQSHRSEHSPKLVAVAVALVVSAVVVTAIALFLSIRRRRMRRSFRVDKTYGSDTSSRLFHTRAGNAANGNRKSQRSATNSSEFLYLGTMVNSRGDIDTHVAPSSGNGAGERLRKLDSPELHPLPPLSRQHTRQDYGNADGGSGGEDEYEEFYSPRGSASGHESSIGTGSASRRAFAGVAADNFERKSSESTYSSSYSSSTSGSPARSISLSTSPPVSSSPKSLRPKSPELLAVQPPPPPTRSPPPPPPPIVTQLTHSRKSPSPSPSSSQASVSPERNLNQTRNSSPRVSDVSDQNAESPARIRSTIQQSIPVYIPTPPPPPPPGHWESSASVGIRPTPPVLKPPAFIAPSRPVAIQNPIPIPPIELQMRSVTVEKNEETPKPKLKPLHWDKVRASSDREMVWDQLKSSSFKLNEEMIETLFVVNTPNSNSKDATRRPVLPRPNQENRVLDPKKSQNIAISLRALNVTIEEVCDALLEGNADALGTELLECLQKMVPTKEEERKLKEYKDDSPVKLGPAEKFLKTVLEIPFAFRRVDAMLYIANFDSEVEYLKKSFETLEGACEELRNSRMFMKLLEAVLKTGNRMNVGTNRGDAHAFKLDTLLKLVDVKGADGKTTLLHFVVQEIIRSEGARLSGANQNPKPACSDDTKYRKLGLQVVSGLSSELTNVKKAAAMDSDVLSGDVLKLSKGIGNMNEVVRLNESVGSEESCRKFSESMNTFMKMAEEEIIKIQAQESVALSLVKEITEYFHGNSAKEEAHPFRIFMVVRDFLTVLDRVCKEVGMINERTIVSSAHKFPVPVNPTLPPAFSEFPGRRQYSSSDEDSSSS